MTEQLSMHARIRRLLGKVIYASLGIFLETPSSDSPQTQALVHRGILPVSFRSKGTEDQRDQAARSHQTVIWQNQDSRPCLWTSDVGSSHLRATHGEDGSCPPSGTASSRPDLCPVPVTCGDVQGSWYTTLLSHGLAGSIGRCESAGPRACHAGSTRVL